LRILRTSFNSEKLANRVNGNLVGFTSGKIELSGRNAVRHIIAIEVLPFYRRIGVAELLMKELEKILEQKDLQNARLKSAKKNCCVKTPRKKSGTKRLLG
jgi:ribosomal protein S18 acetylase RimI-like enzyme